MNPTTLLLYTATWTVVALTPGPAVMCSMAQATRFGWRASLSGISGIQTGNLLFFAAIACGLAALLATATPAFSALRIVGAIYLCYLGARVLWQTFRRRVPAIRSVTDATPRRKLFVQGLLIQLTNPKALLFVSALLPQFIDAARPALPQLAPLLAVTLAVDTVVLSSYALLAERGARTLGTSFFVRWLERVFGAALLFFGSRLLLARR